MKTYRITNKEIKGQKPLAVGYKIFPHDWVSKGYDYKDKKGNVLGTIHKVDGEISECNWGLHFSRLPHNCFNFYESVQWNKFAKVEAYGEIKESEDGNKTVAQILKIVEVYSFDEFVKLIQKELQKDLSGGNDIRGGNDIFYCAKCEGVSRCILCFDYTGKLSIFNKRVDEKRFEEVRNRIREFDWYPRFNNAEALKGNLEWYETNIPAIVNVPNKDAWALMPKALEEYIKSMPEYDAEIFAKITGDLEERTDD